MLCKSRKENMFLVTAVVHTDNAQSTWRRPSSGAPTQITDSLATCRPWIFAGKSSVSGASRNEKLHFKLSGACGINSRQYCKTRVISSPKHTPVPNKMEFNG